MSGKQGSRRLLRLVLTGLVVGGALAWLGAGLLRQWPLIRAYHWQPHVPLLALSLVFAGGWFALRARLWQLILAGLGCPLPYRAAFRAWALSELGRFLPGTVWYVAGRAYLCAECGVAATASLAGMGMELALVSVTALAFLAVRATSALAALGERLPLLLGVVVLAAAAHPRVLVPLANRVLERLGRPPLPVMPGRTYLGLLGLSALMWCSLAAGFACFAIGVAGAGSRQALALASSFPVAWLAGVVVVVSPGGLGVRETVLAALLTGPLPAPLALPVALLSRFWITLPELACALLALRLHLRPPATPPSAVPPLPPS